MQKGEVQRYSFDTDLLLPLAKGYEQTGCAQSMFANRLSWWFDFRGPSKCVDTGKLIFQFSTRCKMTCMTAGGVCRNKSMHQELL